MDILPDLKHYYYYYILPILPAVNASMFFVKCQPIHFYCAQSTSLKTKIQNSGQFHYIKWAHAKNPL